jgi:ribosomal protein S27E
VSTAAQTARGAAERAWASGTRGAGGSEPPVAPGSLVGDVEGVLRTHGPLSADRIAARLHRRRAAVLEALEEHPLIYRAGGRRRGRACCWALAAAGFDVAPVEFKQDELAARPRAEYVTVTCPDCGASHAVVPNHARKIARGLRSERCESCRRRGAGSLMAFLARPPLPREQFEHYARWWFERGLSDRDLRDCAHAFGCEEASIEAVAAWRLRLSGTRASR